MIAGLIESAIRWFENRSWSPGAVIKAAGILNKGIGLGFDEQMIAGIQRLRLRRAVNYMHNNSPFYREIFKSLGIQPGDIRTIKDLRRLPFTTPDDIRNWKRFLCVGEDKISAVFTTSGTTSEPKRVYFTLRDIRVLINLYAAVLHVTHNGRLVTLIALPLSHGLWIGSASALRAVELAGGLPLPVGAGDPGETIKWMKRFEPNVVISSPSYMTALTREAERTGYRPKLDMALLGGEPLTDNHKRVFKEYWGAEVFDSYGSTEIGSAQTIALPECAAFHLNDLHLVTEIINPESGEPAVEGELVFTTLRREAMPFLRYRSGDRGRWADCGCRLPFSAVNLLGRTDDMIIAGDMNLSSRVIADAAAGVAGTTGRIAIELDKDNLTDKMVLSVEGTDVKVEEVKQALFSVYPEIKANMENGGIILDIYTDARLRQIKDIKTTDKRYKK